MQISEKIQRMVDIINSLDKELRNDNDVYKHYLAPDFPEKIISKLTKIFDNHLAINSLVAFYDETLFGSCKTGLLFTKDGMYYKYIGKPVYFQYASILSMDDSGNGLVLKLFSEDMLDYTVFTAFDYGTLKTILEKLIIIDKEFGATSRKKTGKVKKMDIPPDKLKKCKAIIHTASVACGGVGAGLAQIPASDTAVIVPIQITMITSIGAVFDLRLEESVVKGMLGSITATLQGRGISQLAIGWIPLLGNAVNMATAAGLTEAIGWNAVQICHDRWIEDKNKGRYDGMKDGYKEASAEYERKLKRQADEFLNQMKDIEKERDEYEKLLNDYESYIKELEEKNAASDLIGDIKSLYSELKKLDDE